MKSCPKPILRLAGRGLQVDLLSSHCTVVVAAHGSILSLAVNRNSGNWNSAYTSLQECRREE